MGTRSPIVKNAPGHDAFRFFDVEQSITIQSEQGVHLPKLSRIRNMPVLRSIFVMGPTVSSSSW